MIREGKALIVTDGVFYNPRMKFCRDLDMLIFSKLDAKNYLDSLAASGVRGIRAALEAEYQPIFNDRDKRAVEVIRRNLSLNGVEAEVYNTDAAVLMRERNFDHVDVDPFGSPVEFIDSACYSAKKYLSVTATDTAALCGSATLAGLRKYSAFAVKTDVYPEIGVRMLIGFIAREATRYEKHVRVVASWSKEHYYRVHIKLKKSASLSGKVYEKIGYIFYCPRCLAKYVSLMDGSTRETCNCKERLFMLGPLWTGELKDANLLESLLNDTQLSNPLKSFLTRIVQEADSPLAYNIQQLASRLGLRAPKTEEVIYFLQEIGYEASGTHYCGYCIKTSAGVEEVRRAITELVRGYKRS
jgi:tRNA (guanine26-N2/guanine27-N2)-dimethyltransferase